MPQIAGNQSDPTQAPDSGVPQGDTNEPETQEGAENEPREAKRNKDEDAKEKLLVAKFWKEQDTTRKFDENFRKQVAIDRRYAAGTSDTSWAVTTNIIGAFIEVLVALLYARDPDVSVKKSPQVDEGGTFEMEQFAKTCEIVISRLWKDAALKHKARKQVRAGLSVAEGWLKCTMRSDKNPQPKLETAMNDVQETLGHLRAVSETLEDNDGLDAETRECLIEENEQLKKNLEDKIEATVKRCFVVDFCRTETIQVSTDVEQIEDYRDANWISNETFSSKEEVLAMFERLEPEDLKQAKIYYQNQPKELTTRDVDNILPQGSLTASDAEGYTANTSEQQAVGVLRIVERWDRRDKTIRTAIEGVKVWAEAPFEPPYPASRFYPYFYLSFFESDGQRHAQSLSWRMYKLQDEYSCTRSNFRITRERAIPGTIGNSEMIEANEMRKIQDGKHQEFIMVKLIDPEKKIGDVFTAKPVSPIDPRLFDTTPILADAERISGVAEALQAAQAPGTPQTATEASIQNSGTTARTTYYRDNIEWQLADMAKYTLEQALQCLPSKAVIRLAGPKAIWPEGMDLDDLFNLVEVGIAAGSTGKPRMHADQAAWGVILPLIEKLVGAIEQARATGNVPLANAFSELIKETMLRMGDETDVSRFIPQVPPPGSPAAGAPRMAPPAEVKVQIKGEIDPATSLALVQPTLQMDAAAAPPPPGGTPAPGGSPAGPAAPISPIAPGNSAPHP